MLAGCYGSASPIEVIYFFVLPFSVSWISEMLVSSSGGGGHCKEMLFKRVLHFDKGFDPLHRVTPATSSFSWERVRARVGAEKLMQIILLW
jgi:hypothetical protein